MEHRTLGRTGRDVSVVGLGTWQLGADWGEVSESDALDVLSASVEAGVTFFDTADVYGDGRSEQIIGTFLRSHPDVMVATKMGRRVDQALSAIARPNLASVQIILNAFRLKPLDAVLPAAIDAGVGIIARVPLASGLLSGKYDASTTFAADDHRSYNRDGSAFDVGETFSGVDYETGLRAAAEFTSLVSSYAPQDATSAQAAIAWVAQLPGVSTVIPGARSPEQARANAEAGSLPDLGDDLRHGVQRIYDEHLRAAIHPRW